MYVVIVGCGEAGYHLTKALLAAGHEVTVVERDAGKCELLFDELGSVVSHGDGTAVADLRRAGTARAEVFIGVAGRDETTLVACQIAKHVFQVTHTLAVVKNTKNEPLFGVLGVDVVVNATRLVVTALEEGVPGQPLIHLRNAGGPNQTIVSVPVPDDAAIAGRRVGEIALPPHSFVSLVIKREQALLPAHDLVVEGRDELVAVTTAEEEQALYEIVTGV